MRSIDTSQIPDRNSLVLLTADDIAAGIPMMMADFRDTQVLVFVKTGNFIGMAIDGSIRLGCRPPRMINGVWYSREDTKVLNFSDVVLEPELLTLEPI